MLLTVDAGNTNTVIAVFKEEKAVFVSRVNTDAARMADQYAIIFRDILKLYETDINGIDGAIISSVVPPATRQIIAAAKMLLGIDALVVGPGLKTGLNIRIDEPSSLGADLVCGAVAAKALYPAPCVAVDLGTVTKVMALDKDGALIGGVLAPGVGISFEAMAGKTALLPLVGAERVERVIGTNTADSIRAGILIGAACMLDGLIERFEAELGDCSAVATGGFSEIIAPYCKRKITVNKNLVSEGMRIIYEKNGYSRSN
ncbi:MAG: type III pantothenate kinase [Oscillospiraceae bacterium]|jgi:type III pantothenate kinase|nr:type III pantothenate kinase [Oscillospiraceae bacterium]